MMKIACLLTLLVAVLVCLLAAVPAQAAAARTFVSAAGSDSNNCTNVATPCRHLATAYAATAANGEIYVLDPANYGSLTITGPVSIEGHGWASIAPVSGQAAITINANAGDAINIIGVVLDGTNLANTAGILFNSGGRLNIRDSVIRNFTLDGIKFAPTGASDLFVSNTLTADNGGDGVFVSWGGTGNVSAVFNRVEAIDNQGTANFNILGSPSGTLNAVVIDSVASGDRTNGGAGFFLNTGGQNAGTTLEVLHSVATNNVLGFYVEAGIIYVANSMITGNTLGWQSTGGDQSYGDNYIDGNGGQQGAPAKIPTK